MGRFSNVITTNNIDRNKRKTTVVRGAQWWNAKGITDNDEIVVLQNFKNSIPPVLTLLSPSSLWEELEKQEVTHADITELMNDLTGKTVGVTSRGQEIRVSMRSTPVNIDTVLFYLRKHKHNLEKMREDMTEVNSVCTECDNGKYTTNAGNSVTCARCLGTVKVPNWYAHQRDAKNHA